MEYVCYNLISRKQQIFQERLDVQMAKRRIGILTSGGDCPGLNATIRGAAKACYSMFGEDNVEIVGISNGFHGLIHNNCRIMKPEDFSGILTQGGTILGTKRTPYKMMQVIEADNIDKVAEMKATYKQQKLDCILTLGGNGTHKTANLLSEEGLNIIGLPKTIDNDIWGTDVTFGFHTAVDIATEVVDRIHTTATSHRRIMVIEIMGNKAGWLTLYSGIAGGADVILLPEIPYDINKVVDSLYLRTGQGKRFCILAVAEGALSKKEAEMSKKEFKASRANMSFPSVSYRVAHEIVELTGREVRVTVPGHFQRGGGPCPYDRLLATRFGTAAVRLIEEGNFGNMVALQNGNIVAVPLNEVAGKLKYVPKDSNIIQSARDVGICFGD